jgi:proteic killer suppression protein
MKIVSVRDKRVKKLVNDPSLTAVKGLDAFMVRRLSDQIAAITVMTHPKQLIEGFPAWKAHELKPGQPGTWSLTVTGNWRLTFFCDVNAQECSLLDLVDYH